MRIVPRGLLYSVILHAILFLVIFFGLPSFFNKRIIEDQVVTVEILPVSEFTNIKPLKAKPKARPNKRKVTAAEIPKISMPDPTVKPKVEEKVEPVPEPVKKKPEEAVKKVEVEPLKKPEKEKADENKLVKEPEINIDDAFAAAMKTVEELNVKEGEEPDKNVDLSQVEDLLSNAEEQPKYKPGLPLSLSEKDAIKQQIMKNWSLSTASGAKDAKDMLVTLRVDFLIDGTVTDIDIQNKMRYNTDGFYQAMVDSAVRAVWKSSPLKNLPIEKYDVKDGWREMEINFDPSEMLY